MWRLECEHNLQHNCRGGRRWRGLLDQERFWMPAGQEPLPWDMVGATVRLSPMPFVEGVRASQRMPQTGPGRFDEDALKCLARSREIFEYCAWG